jgi:hypothetical protein
MNLGLTFETNLGLDKQKLFIEISNILQHYFAPKNYGSDIEHFLIGVISVKTEFEQYFNVRKPKYKELEKIKLLDDSIKELKRIFTYDIKLNFDEIVSVTDEESKRLLVQEIIKSLSNLDALPKKVKDFDRDNFKTDLKQLFIENNLL